MQGDGNHDDSTPVEITGVVITQKALAITAKAQSISYGNSIAPGVGQVTAEGLVDGDALTAVTLTPSTDQVTTSGTITPSAATTTNGISNYSVTYNTGTLTINKVAASVTTAPTGKTSLTYTGEAQELVDATSAASTGGTLVYSKTENGTYGAASTITETNAGTYSFWYKVLGDGNHDDSTPVEITGVVIAKAALSSLSVSMSGWTYGGTATSPSVSNNSGDGTVTYNYKVSTAADNTYSTTKPTNAGTYTVRASVAETANYNAGTATANFTIGKAALSSLSVSMSGWTYGGTATSPSVSNNSGDGTVTYNYKVSTAADNTYSTTKPTNAGTYTVRASVAETANYNAGTATANFTINKVAASVTTAPAAVTSDLTYTGGALTLFNAGSVTGGTLKYKVTTSSTKPENTDGFKTTIDQKTDAGTYYLWYYVAADGNHTDTEINTTPISKTITRIESATVGSYQCAKIWISASGGYYVVCSDAKAGDTWSEACGRSMIEGGKTFKCGTKDQWEAIMSACGGTGHSYINSKCSSVTGWSEMSGKYWSSTESSNTNNAWDFNGTLWTRDAKFNGLHVRLVSVF